MNGLRESTELYLWVSAVNLVAIGHHVNHHGDTLSGLPKYIRGVFQKYYHFLACPESSFAKTCVEDLRLRYCFFLFGVCQQSVPPCILLLTSIKLIYPESSPQFHSFVIAMWLIYCGATIAISNKSKFHSRHVFMLFYLTATVYFIRILSFNDNPNFYASSGNRVLLRIFFGLMVLDWKTTVWFNAVTAVVTCWKHLHNITAFRQDIVSNAPPLSTVVLLEIFQHFGVVLVLFIFEFWIIHCTRAQLDVKAAKLDAKAAHHLQLAVRTLLSALCDAEVHLGSSMEMLKPSQKLSNMLLSPYGGGSLEGLEGLNFSEFVAPEDRQRFCSFLATASCHFPTSVPMNQTEEPLGSIGPPSSMQVRLRNENGATFNVALYHVILPDANNQLGHLVGIRDCSPLEREREMGMVESRDPSLSIAKEVEACSGPPKEIRWPVEDTATDSSGSSESSSMSGCSNWLSASDMLEKELKDLESMSIEFDAGASRFNVRKITFNFEDGGTIDRRNQPQVADWMQSAPWKAFRTWVQEEVNMQSSCCQSPCSLFGPIVLKWPRRSGLLEQVAMKAKTAQLESEDIDELEEMSNSLLVRVTLRDIVQISRGRSARRNSHVRHGGHLAAVHESAHEEQEYL